MRVTELLDRISLQRAAFDRARELYADRLAPSFSPFQFIQANELGLSRILCWLLNPQGTHAQGPSFLEAFVKHFPISWDASACAGANVKLEAPMKMLADARRIDVLVSSTRVIRPPRNRN